MTKKIILGLVFLMSIAMKAQQKNINNYKYIIVKDRFDFLKNYDQYQTSSLTKFLFKRNGYQTYLSNETFPEDLIKDRCLALEASVKNKKNLFFIKNTIVLKDCYNNIVFTSEEGRSKEKDYKKGYHEAIRKAFESIESLNYKYSPVQKNLKEVTVKKDATHSENMTKEEEKNIVKEKPKKEIKKNKPVVIVETPKITPKKNTEIKKKESSLKVLYAQEKDYGFQLVNTEPKIVFQILKTKLENVFILKDKNGILFKGKKGWIAEYYVNGKKVFEEYQIKF